ncbi:unnamed protein product [Oncorhynchus mykiss]|uniref:C-type lectin domain-containing protein n=1 Tax=Oncorhynchus mykiss TaxID=8022 RepID=A0A060Y140_ONCMY|nr:unnamed protein product [Oncorhynchus mykiss]
MLSPQDFCSASQQARSPSSWITLFLLYSIVTMCTRVEGWSYHHSNESMNWDTARKWCTEHYTDMVAIQNRGEISHLKGPQSRSSFQFAAASDRNELQQTLKLDSFISISSFNDSNNGHTY